MSPKNELDILCPTCGKIFKSEEEILEHYDSQHGQANAIEQANSIDATDKRPVGLTIISVVWLIFGLFNIYSAFQTINVDIENLPYLSGYGVPEWFNVAIPVEMVLSIVALCLGLLQVVTVFGLLKGKKYSYKLGLGIPIALPIINILFVALYVSAPAGVDLSFNSSIYGGLIGGGIFWAIIYWQYLRKPHVKAYLGIIEAQSQTPKSGSRKILNRKIVVALVLVFSIITVGTVGYIVSLPSKIAYDMIIKDTTLNLSAEDRKTIIDPKKEDDALKGQVKMLYRQVYVPAKGDTFKAINLGIPTYGDKKSLDESVYEQLRIDGEISEKISSAVLASKYLSERKVQRQNKFTTHF